ncbi:MAG: leucine-rich repeat protein, partial [Paludibacteraceae bacterium]|nr:leucine-rich repeat protein [Paludibacteraceae bacterium]
MKKIVFFLFVVSLTLVSAKTYATDYTSGNTNVTYNTSTKTLTISAKSGTDGRMADANSKTDIPWNSYTFTMTNVVVEEGVTYIGTNSFNMTEAFQGTTKANNLASVTIPSTVTAIGIDAFRGCNNVASIHASTPNDWARIEFPTTTVNSIAYPFSHPFCASASSNRIFYFYGKTGNYTNRSVIVFTADLSAIKSYAFYKATSIVDVYIPGTITSIGAHALDCGITNLYVNKQTPPTLGTTAISFVNSTSSRLFIRYDANADYKQKPWYNNSAETDGAKYIGKSGEK